MKLVKTLSILLVIVIVFGGAMFALDLYTGPIIDANNAGAEFAPLLAVMPEGATFDGNAKLDLTTLNDVPASVTAIYREANGLGYAIQTTAESDYSTAPMEITIGISADGKICGLQIDSYNDTPSFDFRTKDPSYLPSFVGKDSALADIGTVAGATYSSTAFKNAVSDAMGVLIANDMIAAGVKSDAQILTELVPTVAPGFVKPAEVSGVSGNIQVALKAENGAGFAYIMTEGDESFLAVVNAFGFCTVYDVNGADVTDAHAAIVTEAKAHAAANQTDYLAALETKIGRMMTGATDITALNVELYDSIVAAVSFKVEDATYYGFYSRTYGFHQMDVFFVIDENGAIAKMDATTFIFEQEYFFNFGFVGITSETFEDQAIIATATMTSNAVKQSTLDAFAAFDSVKGGEA